MSWREESRRVGGTHQLNSRKKSNAMCWLNADYSALNHSEETNSNWVSNTHHQRRMEWQISQRIWSDVTFALYSQSNRHSWRVSHSRECRTFQMKCTNIQTEWINEQMWYHRCCRHKFNEHRTDSIWKSNNDKRLLQVLPVSIKVVSKSSSCLLNTGEGK